MTDNKPQPSHSPQPAPPKPPTDEQRVSEQVGVTDMTTTAGEALSGFFPFGGPVRFFGTTDFENHQLNDMIDLVAHANPEHLTSAGDALFRARDAIKKAAQELQANVRAVHWEGEAGNAFRAWGDKLAGHSQKLSDFADVAAVQISAAGSGLASVSKAMPQRDQRAQPVKVADIPPTKRVAGNAEYEAAVKVEKDRQEAINQMNRLSSFYSVSEQTLAAQQPPVFEPMPQVGVPQPLPGGGGSDRDHSPGAAPPARHSTVERPVSRHTESITTGHAAREVAGAPIPAAGSGGSDTSPILPVGSSGTELNSVSAPIAPATSQVVAPPSTVTATGPAGSPVAPSFGMPVSPMPSAPRTSGGASSIRFPASTSSGDVGRRAAGFPSRGGTSAQGVGGEGSPSGGQTSSPMGRGVSGGTPRVGSGTGSARPSTGVARTGRGSGIVGGRPGAPASNAADSRMPRGTVVGKEVQPGSSNSAARPGQRGVVGANSPNSSKSQSARRPLSNPDGVVGAPQRRSTAARAGRSGFSRGGEGLVRDSDGEASSEEEETMPHAEELVEGERDVRT